MWHLSINVFGKKGTSETVFYCLLSSLLGSRSTDDAHWGVPSTDGAVSLPSTEQGGRARMVRGAHPLTGLTVQTAAWWQGKSGIPPAREQVRATRRWAVCRHISEMAPAKNRTQEHVWGRATCSKVPKGRTTNAVKQMLLSVTLYNALNKWVLAFLMALTVICSSLPS